MHLIIVEDLEIDRDNLAGILREDFIRRKESVDFSFYASGEEFLEHYRPKSCDGLFLDILLGGITGMEIARKVRKAEPRLPIIFTTRERAYAVDSYDIQVSDYLLKPFTPERVFRCMERVREYLSAPSSIPLLETSGWGHAAPVDVPLDEILYGQYGNHIMDVHTTQGVFCTRLSFRDFTALLPHSGRFLVCGRGLVVNMAQVREVRDGTLLLKNGEVLSFSRSRKQEIQRVHTEWKFSRARKGRLV